MTNELKNLREKYARLEKENLVKAVQIADLQDELGKARHKYNDMREIVRREREENATLADKLQATEYLLEERTGDIILMEEAHAEEIGVLKEKLRKEKELNINAQATCDYLKRKVESLEWYINLLEYSYKQRDNDIRELREKWNNLNELFAIQDECIDGMVEIFEDVESVCEKWEKASKMMINNDHHAIAGIALQKMAAEIKAVL